MYCERPFFTLKHKGSKLCLNLNINGRTFTLQDQEDLKVLEDLMAGQVLLEGLVQLELLDVKEYKGTLVLLDQPVGQVLQELLVEKVHVVSMVFNFCTIYASTVELNV